MKAIGLLNPKSFVESTGGFQEGLVRVDQSVFKVHQGRVGEGQPARQPFTALVWTVNRLDEDDHEPLTDDDGNPKTEELVFGLGGKSLTGAHPGGADSPDDEEVEDLGVDVGTEGPTVFLASPTFKLNSKSGCAVLMDSLQKAGFKEEYLNRVWSPDYVGSVFHVKNFVSDQVMKGDDGKDRPITYKVVGKIIRAGYEQKKKAGAGQMSQPKGKAAAGGKAEVSEEEKALRKALDSLSEKLDGSQVTRKALSTKVLQELQAAKVSPTLHVKALSLVKDDGWLGKNGPQYDITFDAEEGTVVFGTLADAGAE